jgi:FKBP-type peptidyl-prolyl cis-trans isomerase
MRSLAITLIALSLAGCAGYKDPDDRARATTTAETTTTTAAATTPTPAPTPAQGAGMDTFAMPANLQSTPSGLRYSIDRPGTGEKPRQGQTVSVHYTGWLTNGNEFDSSRKRGTPLEFNLGAGRVIRGWEEGVADMHIGEVRTLVIPPALGYGERGFPGAIPPNSTLVFKVELLGAR